MQFHRSSGWFLTASALTITIAAQTPKPAFEVVSIKRLAAGQRPGPRPPVAPNVFYHGGDSVDLLVRFAYNVAEFQVIGGPDWARRDRFQVIGKAASAVSDSQMRLMVQALLEDRFKLVIQKEQRDMPLQALEVARADRRLGSKLQKCEDRETAPDVPPIPLSPGTLLFAGRCHEMSEVAVMAANILKTPVIDRTSLSGLWSFIFAYARPQLLSPGDQADQANAPSLSAALQEELGLKLQSGRGPVDILTIESVQPPSEN